MIQNKRTLIIVSTIVGAIFLTILILFLFTKPYVEPSFDHIEIPQTYSIRNSTEYKSLSKVISVGIEELGLDTVYIQVFPLGKWDKENALEEGRELMAHIRAGAQGTKQYVIFIDEDGLTAREYIEIIAHELIHLKQYHTGRLSFNSNTGKVIFNSWPYYNIDQMAYETRPWEIEAFKQSPTLERKIVKRLYGSFK